MADSETVAFHNEIKAFLVRRPEVSRTMLSFNSSGDPNLIRDLEGGKRKFYDPLIAKVRAWMASYELGKVKLTSLYAYREKNRPAGLPRPKRIRAAAPAKKKADKKASKTAKKLAAKKRVCPENTKWCPKCARCISVQPMIPATQLVAAA